MTTSCDSAAAYVLGALPAGERSEFEVHLAQCHDCRQAVAELAGIPGLLSRVSADDLEDDVPVPDTLVPRLLREVRRSSRRRRVVVGGLSAAAVLLAVAGTTVVLDRSGSDPPGVAMTAVVASPVTASVRLVAHPWGTEVTMDCRYADSSEWSLPYSLVAVNHRGESHEIATWVVGPSHEATVSGSVPWQPDAIDRIEVRLGSGQTVLRLRP
jgi:anti-sigma factor RsiW